MGANCSLLVRSYNALAFRRQGHRIYVLAVSSDVPSVPTPSGRRAGRFRFDTNKTSSFPDLPISLPTLGILLCHFALQFLFPQRRTVQRPLHFP